MTVATDFKDNKLVKDTRSLLTNILLLYIKESRKQNPKVTKRTSLCYCPFPTNFQMSKETRIQKEELRGIKEFC